MKVTAWRTVVGAALCALFLAVGHPAAAAGTLTRGNGAAPVTFDPAGASLPAESAILKDLFEGLTIHDPAGRVVPGAAESWSVSADGLVYTFVLRNDATWSTGEPVTADDFVAALRRAVAPDTGAPFASVLYPIANAAAINTATADAPVDVATLGVAATGTKTLTITLEQPAPYLPEILTHTIALPVHRASLAEHGSNAFQPAAIVGNGAFAMSGFDEDHRATLVRRTDYWDAANVALDAVVYEPTDDQMAAVRAFAAGERDVSTPYPADEQAALGERLGADVVRLTPTLSETAIVFDTRKPPFSDVRVRRALAMVVDRSAIAATGVARPEVPLETVVPPGIAGYSPAVAPYAGMTRAERLAAARDLLRDAGFGGDARPLAVTLRYATGHGRDAAIAAIVAAWTEIGVSVTPAAADTRDHYAALAGGAPFDAARVTFTADYADPHAFLAPYVSGAPAFNFGGWQNTRYDEVMARAGNERDAAARSDLLAKAEAILLAEQPIVPLTAFAAPWLVSKAISGWQDNAADDHLSRFLSKN